MRPSELEQRLLSSVRDVDDLMTCTHEGISEESFNDADLKPVWTYIEECIRTNGEVIDEDLLTLHDFEREPAGDLRTYVQLVRAEELRSKVRQVIASQVKALDADDPAEPVSILLRSLREIQSEGVRRAKFADSGWVQRLMEYEELVRLRESGELGIKTGLKTFDDDNMGWRRGELVIVLGPTGCGKSWLITYFAANAYNTGKKVLFISPEMTDTETMWRFEPIYATLINSKSTLSNRALSTGMQDLEKYKAFGKQAWEKNKRSDLVVMDSSQSGRQLSYEDIWTHALEFEPDVIIVDGLHLMTGGGKETKGWEILKEGVEYLKALAQQQNLVVIAAHQPDRSAQKRSGGTPPLLHQIGYGFSVAQSANRVISLGFVEGQGNRRCFIVPKMRGFEEVYHERFINWDVDTGKIWELDKPQNEEFASYKGEEIDDY